MTVAVGFPVGDGDRGADARRDQAGRKAESEKTFPHEYSSGYREQPCRYRPDLSPPRVVLREARMLSAGGHLVKGTSQETRKKLLREWGM